MSKLFQNNIQSEIVAGHFGEDSLEGLYLGGDYFQIKKKLTVYYGTIYGTANGNIAKLTDQQFADRIYGEVADFYTLETSSAKNLEITLKAGVRKPNPNYDPDDASTGGQYIPENTGRQNRFIAIPTSEILSVYTGYSVGNDYLVGQKNSKDIDIIIEKNTSGPQVPMYKREITINGVSYSVFYGFGDPQFTVVVNREQ